MTNTSVIVPRAGPIPELDVMGEGDDHRCPERSRSRETADDVLSKTGRTVAASSATLGIRHLVPTQALGTRSESLS